MKAYAVFDVDFIDSPHYQFRGLFADREQAQSLMKGYGKAIKEDYPYEWRESANECYGEDEDGNWSAVQIVEVETKDFPSFYLTFAWIWGDGVDLLTEVHESREESNRWERMVAEEYGMTYDGDHYTNDDPADMWVARKIIRQ